MSITLQTDPVERVMCAMLEPLYEEQARRRGQKFSKRSGVPGVYSIAEAGMPSELGTLSIEELAGAYNNPMHAFNEMVEAECSKKCGAKFTCMRLFAAMEAVACDACRAKYDKEEKLERAKVYWESICDDAFRDTDKTHPDFPKSQYEATRSYSGTESLMFFGPSGKGKSRLAMILLKRCLVRFNLHVGVLWPEELSAVKGGRGRETLDMVGKWGKYDVLLMDDSISAGAQDGRVTDFLKQLLDYRMRHKRHQIVTTQIGSSEYSEQGDKWGKETKADKQLVEALMRRFKEVCRLISFADLTPKQGEEQF